MPDISQRRKTATLERLKKQLDEQFTIMGGGQVLDEMSTPQDLWQWIVDNFKPRET